MYDVEIGEDRSWGSEFNPTIKFKQARFVYLQVIGGP